MPLNGVISFGGVIVKGRLLLVVLLIIALTIPSAGLASADLKLTPIGGLKPVSSATPALLTAPLSVKSTQATPAAVTSGQSVNLSFNVTPTRSGVVVNIYDSGNNLVRTLTPAGLIQGPAHVTWDGKDSSSKPVKAGTYKVVVQATSHDPYYVYKSQFSYGDSQIMPVFLALDTGGNLYVTDFNYCLFDKIKPDGTLLSSYCSPGTGKSNLEGPYGIAVDSSGSIYVADSENQRIVKYKSDGSYVAQWNSTGPGNPKLGSPVGVAIDRNDNVFVTDYYGCRIVEYTSAGKYITQWGSYGSGPGQLNCPAGIAIDSHNLVYVADSENHRVDVYNSDGSLKRSLTAATGGPGLKSDLPDLYPFAVAIDAQDNVYVSDLGASTVALYSPSGEYYLTRFGSNGTGSGQLNRQFGLTVDSSRNVYVADTYNHRIEVFSPTYPTAQGQTQVAIASAQQATAAPTPTPTASPGQATATPSSSPGQSQVTATPTTDAGQQQASQSSGGGSQASSSQTSGDTTASSTQAASSSSSGGSSASQGQVAGGSGQQASGSGSDAEPPVTSIALSGTAGPTPGSYLSDVTVALAASDGSGSGVKNTQYSLDSRNWENYTGPFTVSKEGTTTVYARSEDNAGNVESAETATFSVTHGAAAKSAGLCGAALLPLLLVGLAAIGSRENGKRW